MGVAVTGSFRPDAFPPSAEQRVGDFADLIAMRSRTSRTCGTDRLAARIVAAADDTRRRIERDLHDGAQQRLVSLGLRLRLAEDSVTPEQMVLREQISDVVTDLVAGSDDCGKCLTVFTQRSCPREGSVLHSGRWRAVPRLR